MWKPKEKLTIKTKKKPQEFNYSDKNELLDLVIRENGLERLNLLRDIDFTILSEDFWKKLDKFDWDENDKKEFILEMLALSPEERQNILDNMIRNDDLVKRKKSENKYVKNILRRYTMNDKSSTSKDKEKKTTIKKPATKKADTKSPAKSKTVKAKSKKKPTVKESEEKSFAVEAAENIEAGAQLVVDRASEAASEILEKTSDLASTVFEKVKEGVSDVYDLSFKRR